MAKENLEQVIADLRKSLAWLDLVLANLNEGVITLEKDMRIHFANDAMADMLHINRIFLLGASIWEALPIAENGKTLKKKDYANALAKNNIQSLDGIYTLKLANKTLIVEVTFGYIPKIKQIAVVIRDITQLKLDESIVRLHQKVAVTANESTSIDEALQISLDLICDHTGWPIGHVYMVSKNSQSELTPSKIWHLTNPKKFSAFRKITEKTTFKKGIGLPGRVFASRKPVWITDVQKDNNFPRRNHTKNIGIKAGFAFPILVKKEVAGVLEFFSTEAIKSDKALLKVMAHIGTQLGQVIERTRSEEERIQFMREQITRAEVEASEKRYRRLVESTNVIPWEADASTGKFIYVGPQAEKILGYPIKDWYSDTFWPDHIHPEDREWTVNFCLNALKSKQEYEFEYRMLTKDKKVLWLRDIVSVVIKEDGKKVLTGFFVDITERKEAEEALRKSEARLRFMAESMPQKVFTANPNGDIDYFNPQWMEFTGLTFEQIRNWGWTQFIHPEDVAENVRRWKHSIKTGEPFQLEHRFRRRDGAYRWHLSRALPMRDEKGKILKWFGSNTDIHDQKITEQKLEESQANLAYLAEASRILSSSLDYKTTLTNIAKAAVPKIADWCAIDLLDGKGSLEQVSVAHKDTTKIKWAKELRKADPPDMNAPTGVPNVIRTGKSEFYQQITDEVLIKVAKNKRHLKLLRSIGFTSAMIVPLYQERKCIGGITFVTTETKRQYTKADLAMAEELARRASLALENAGLYKASQDAVTLRDDFISVASHELKTPITSVKIFTEVMQQHSKQIGDQQALTHLTKMNKQLDKLTELIYNMLNISKIQAGRLEFNQKLFSLDGTVSEIVDVLQQGATKHKLVVEGKTNNKIYGDEDRIGQVVSNLVSNAIKYSPKADKVIIHLSSNHENVIVCVEDFGIGLAKEHGLRIFERFYRVFDETDKTFPGLGIGLYISSEIIKRHHGKLWVESDTGKGSKFYFSLPIKRDKKPNGVQVL